MMTKVEVSALGAVGSDRVAYQGHSAGESYGNHENETCLGCHRRWRVA